jgi:hypothetical protein
LHHPGQAKSREKRLKSSVLGRRGGRHLPVISTALVRDYLNDNVEAVLSISSTSVRPVDASSLTTITPPFFLK